MRTRYLLLWLLAGALAACSRSFPSTLPQRSAASSEATEAPAAVVGRSIREEVPLPGEPTDGWVGLETSESTHGEHVHAR